MNLPTLYENLTPLDLAIIVGYVIEQEKQIKYKKRGFLERIIKKLKSDYLLTEKEIAKSLRLGTFEVEEIIADGHPRKLSPDLNPVENCPCCNHHYGHPKDKDTYCPNCYSMILPTTSVNSPLF